MAGKLTQKETEAFYDISAGFDEFDPGIDAFTEVVRRAEAFLNHNGGYDSINYPGTLLELNDQWEYFDQTAKVTGKVYVLEEGIVELASEGWAGPYRDNRGIYFLVDDADLVSIGVVDTLATVQGDVAEDGSLHRPVALAFGFNPEDLESDIPMFYAIPDDILTMKYDLPTLDAVDSRLHRDWPEEMETLDRRISSAAYDPMKLIKKLRKTIDGMQSQLRESNELQLNIARYIHHAIELDRSWPYGVTIQGPAFYKENMNEPLEPVVFSDSSLHYLKSAGVSMQEYTNEAPHRMELSLIFASPSSLTDGEAVDGQLLVPLSSIKGMFSTRPLGSISESVTLAKDKRARELHPHEADIVLPDVEAEKFVHPHIVEYRRLEALEQLLHDIQIKTKDAQRVRHTDQRDALEVSSNLAKWFHEEVQILGLERTDLLRVSGPGIAKANGMFNHQGRQFKIDIDEENPIINPTAAADTIGSYEGMIAEVDGFEDEKGNAFWQVAPKLAITLSEVSQPLVKETYPLLSVAVKSSALARLDDKTFFEIPKLDAIRRRHAAMTALATSSPGSTALQDARTIDRAFFNEDPNSWVEARSVLKTIRRIAEGGSQQSQPELLEVLKQQLVGRRIEIDGHTWFGNGRSDDHHNVGVVTDMFSADLPDGTNELVINIANGTGRDDAQRSQEPASLVILRTATVLKF